MRDEVHYRFVELIEALTYRAFVRSVAFAGVRILFGLLPTRRYSIYQMILRVQRALSLKRDREHQANESRLIDYFRTRHDPLRPLWRLYQATGEAKQIQNEFAGYDITNRVRIRFPRQNDFPEREGDLKILKPWISSNEKGVLLIKYNDSFKRFIANFNMPKIARDYRIVLEPSTWGYQGIDILIYLNIGTDVVVQAQRKEDYDYIEKIGCNFKPIRIGAGDWINPNLFSVGNQQKKQYDLIMVASWLSLKRHKLLFQALARIRDRIGSVALVGYPINGRSSKDIIAECERYRLRNKIRIFENVPGSKVNELLKASKFSIMLSKREGASKAIYESLFTDVPVIVSKGNIGVNHEHINPATGIFARDGELNESILYMKEHYKRFSPRQWALNHTGCFNSSRKLNRLIMESALRNGEQWSQSLFQRMGPVNHIYKDESDFALAQREFERLKGYLK